MTEDKIIGVKLPIKVDLKVTDAPPAVKGNTVSGGSKQITLETGAIINGPLFYFLMKVRLSGSILKPANM